MIKDKINNPKKEKENFQSVEKYKYGTMFWIGLKKMKVFRFGCEITATKFRVNLRQKGKERKGRKEERVEGRKIVER